MVTTRLFRIRQVQGTRQKNIEDGRLQPRIEGNQKNSSRKPIGAISTISIDIQWKETSRTKLGNKL